MEHARKNQVLEILDYWKITEFLGQADIPEDNPDNRKRIDKIRKGQKVTANKIEIFSPLVRFPVQTEETLEKDGEAYTDFPVTGDELSFCMGRIPRNDVVDYLDKFMDSREERPEIAYPRKSAIACFSFQTDTEGLYLEGSFRLSPILWAISVWEKNLAQSSHDFSLNTREYDEIVEKIDAELTDENVSVFLEALYNRIYREFVQKSFQSPGQDSPGFMAYCRYPSQEKRDMDEDPADYSDLGKSFFLNDIILLSELVDANEFGDGSEYEERVISYILAGYEKTKGMGSMARTVISPGEPVPAMRAFFEKILNVNKAPMGKWPARFMPALMQQVAVNIAIDKEGHTPIFSVNGPPGTGKTTLLKEIIASNIVDRALLLAKSGTDPDALFEKRSFRQGPLEDRGNAYYQYAPNYYALKDDTVNDYGMLVASCNNAAVENITIDLPKGKDILESLESSERDDEAVKKGLDEVHALFDLEKSEDVETITVYKKSREEKDIFFTRYANKLLDRNDCWGLISAPFGKRSNIRKYCNAVLKPFLEEYKSNTSRELHKQKYAKQRERFLRQYELVEKLQKELAQLCAACESIPVSCESIPASGESIPASGGSISSGESIPAFGESVPASGRNIPVSGGNIPSWLQSLSPEELSGKRTSLENERQSLTARIKAEQKEVMELEETRPKGLFPWQKNTSTRDKLIAEHQENIAALKKSLSGIDNALAAIRRREESRALLQGYSQGAKKLSPIDGDFMEKYRSLDEDEATEAQVTNPWFTHQYNREREKLFLYACKLHKEFVTASKCIRHNIINLLIAWNMFDECGERMSAEDRKAAMPVLLQSIFLMTPVISTTFASAQTFLGDIEESGVLGTLIVDESGQAQPQMAVGAMFRCRKSIIVGDPKQIEPVVTAETDMIKQLLTSKILAGYKDKKVSVQGFADYINPYGTFLGEEEEKEWVGCPLVVHRRCIDPMYTISNILSYDGTMKQQTGAPKEKKVATFILEKSCWINVSGSENSGKKDHFVNAQGEVALKLLAAKFKKDPGEIPGLFIISPFSSVKNGMIDMIKKSSLYKEEPRVKNWLEKNNIGTVHTFQGQGTDEVIFLLGCDKNSTGAANWVNKNIVNVAATRAKFRFYIIGDSSVWMCKPVKLARECTAEVIEAAGLDGLLPPVDGARMDATDAANTPKYNLPATQQQSAKSANTANTNGSVTQQPKATTTDAPKRSIPAAQPQKPKTADVPKSGTNGSSQPVCPKCGKPLIEKNGKYGKFLGCTGFPKCKYTAKIPKSE